jgi:hypothetical protein
LNESPQGGAARKQRRVRGGGATAELQGARRGSVSPSTSMISHRADFPLPTQVESLPALQLASWPPCWMPTLFVAAGATGGRILQLLKHRVSTSVGPLEELPAIRFLLLDTDPGTLAEATRGDQLTALRINETIPMPLRDASYYRHKSDALLEWLHRRWLYNIPRTLRTEGIRSLGRLALVDHFAAVDAALRERWKRRRPRPRCSKPASGPGCPLRPGRCAWSCSPPPPVAPGEA